MTKILHILDHSTPVADGYSIRSQNIVRCQRDLGLEPVVVTSARHVDRYGAPELGEVEVINGIRFYRSATANESGLPLIPEYQRLRRMVRRIGEVVELEQPDILHAHSPCLWGLAAGRVARRTKLPFVYEIRGFWEDALVDSGKTTERSIRYRLIRLVEARVCRSAKVVTTIAHGLKSDLVARGIDADRVFLVPNGVEAQRFSRMAPDQQLIAELGLEGKTLVGYIGSLYAWEGIDELIRAVPTIVQEAPQTRILIVGGGELASTIEPLIRELDVAEFVEFVGHVPHQDVTRYYSILDVLIYPRKSTRNTELCTPLKPLEAMAMEKAVVGSNVGGICELFVDGTGLQYAAGEPADLARRCLELISDPERRACMGRAAQAHVSDTRDWKKLVERYVDVYSAALDGRPVTLDLNGSDHGEPTAFGNPAGPPVGQPSCLPPESPKSADGGGYFRAQQS
jgi:PEP-CTERM/exosortase A-associated glycosyltransferase